MVKMNLYQAVKGFSIVNNINNDYKIRKIMSKMDNKFPGKDISIEDIKTKFPLVAKNKYHISRFKISGVEFDQNCSNFAGPNMVESKRLILDVAKMLNQLVQILRWSLQTSHFSLQK